MVRVNHKSSDKSHLLTDCSDRYTSGLPVPGFKEQIREGKCGCNGAARYCCATMRKHLKSRNPVLNIPRRHEPVPTGTVFSDTPAVDSGVKKSKYLLVGIPWLLMLTQ